MKLNEMVKKAMSNEIVRIGYETRMLKIAEHGIDDVAGIDYTNVVQEGLDGNGELTKQAAEETLTREMRRQIVLTGYNDAMNRQ